MSSFKTLAKLAIQRGCIMHSNRFKSIKHGKFFVIIGVANDKVGIFFINSNISNFVHTVKTFLDLQAGIKKENYPDFLKHDSYIGCHQVTELDRNSLEEELKCGNAEIIGELTSEDVELILVNIRSSDVYSKKDKETFFI